MKRHTKILVRGYHENNNYYYLVGIYYSCFEFFAYVHNVSYAVWKENRYL